MARKRGQRPQGAYYKGLSPYEVGLFDARVQSAGSESAPSAQNQP